MHGTLTAGGEKVASDPAARAADSTTEVSDQSSLEHLRNDKSERVVSEAYT